MDDQITDLQALALHQQLADMGVSLDDASDEQLMTAVVGAEQYVQRFDANAEGRVLADERDEVHAEVQAKLDARDEVEDAYGEMLEGHGIDKEAAQPFLDAVLEGVSSGQFENTTESILEATSGAIGAAIGETTKAVREKHWVDHAKKLGYRKGMDAAVQQLQADMSGKSGPQIHPPAEPRPEPTKPPTGVDRNGNERPNHQAALNVGRSYLDGISDGLDNALHARSAQRSAADAAKALVEAGE